MICWHCVLARGRWLPGRTCITPCWCTWVVRPHTGEAAGPRMKYRSQWRTETLIFKVGLQGCTSTVPDMTLDMPGAMVQQFLLLLLALLSLSSSLISAEQLGNGPKGPALLSLTQLPLRPCPAPRSPCPDPLSGWASLFHLSKRTRDQAAAALGHCHRFHLASSWTEPGAVIDLSVRQQLSLFPASLQPRLGGRDSLSSSVCGSFPARKWPPCH